MSGDQVTCRTAESETDTDNTTKLSDDSTAPPGTSGSDNKPRHVPSKLWEKFKALEKRTDEVTKRSTEKRVKHLKKQITETVEEYPDIKSSIERYTVRHHGDKPQNSSPDASSQKESHMHVVEQWKDVKQYLDVNKHLEAGRSSGQSHLEQQIEAAINRGDYSNADKLSDQLANREFGTKISQAFEAREFLKRKKFGTKISQAFEAREFLKRKKEDEARNESKKKKKLNWGFEQKERWETKSNM